MAMMKFLLYIPVIIYTDRTAVGWMRLSPQKRAASWNQCHPTRKGRAPTRWKQRTFGFAREWNFPASPTRVIPSEAHPTLWWPTPVEALHFFPDWGTSKVPSQIFWQERFSFFRWEKSLIEAWQFLKEETTLTLGPEGFAFDFLVDGLNSSSSSSSSGSSCSIPGIGGNIGTSGTWKVILNIKQHKMGHGRSISVE